MSPMIKTGARAAAPKVEAPPAVVSARTDRPKLEVPAPAAAPPVPAKREPFAPGIYPGISNRDYHADPAIGSTSLKTLATRTPAHWKWERANPVHKDIYDIGTITHSLILEQDESGLTVIDVDDKRGNKWSAPANEAREAGKIPLLTKEWEGIKAMRDSVMAHPLARAAFTGHRAEESVFWEEEDGLMLKCRPDAWKPGLLVDLKTTIDADPREFHRTAYKMGYYQSAAHYTDGVENATGERLPFLFVLVEKSAPNLVSVVELDERALSLGREMNARAKRIYRDCLATDEWPGYVTTEPIGLSRWAIREIEELTNV